VEAFDIGDFRTVAGIDQGSNHQDSSELVLHAEDGLFAEQIRFGFFLEGSSR